MMKRAAVILFCAAAVALAQVPVQTINPCLKEACFFATVSGTVGGSSSSTLTIQQPATGARQVTFIAAVVWCNGQAFNVDQSQNGTAASTTAGTAVALIPVQTTGAGVTVTAAAKVFTASNVGAGTATGPTLPYTAGDPRVIGLDQRTMGLSGTANNYTVKMTNTGSGSCTGGVAIYWSEKI